MNIPALMVKDHCKIEALLTDLEKAVEQDYSMMLKTFTTFEWELEKHIFIEEKAIFTSYHPDNVVEGYKMLPELTKQHNEILNRLNIMRKQLRSRQNITDVSGFKTLLMEHRSFEELEVYPQLDQALTEEQKQTIVAKIREMM
ncbi:MAG: hemerythrin domain-containing protein [Candidatus Thermoplasmatota archaeon]|nr:hemerythrin domain-containing protein [Candidatus Thermoplasmatota archaeon]